MEQSAANQAALIRKQIVFTGWVQGVGFRWRARNAADQIGATGWVRNESDGSVTMQIQGTQEQIDAVIRAVEAGRYIQINSMEVRALQPVPDERSFRTEWL